MARSWKGQPLAVSKNSFGGALKGRDFQSRRQAEKN
jgi:hypothetical protein